jgi:hypothetical protein
LRNENFANANSSKDPNIKIKSNVIVGERSQILTNLKMELNLSKLEESKLKRERSKCGLQDKGDIVERVQVTILSARTSN